MSEGRGLFLFPIAAAHELISWEKASEMDIVLDLWLHTIYQDSQVQGSDKGPVVYFGMEPEIRLPIFQTWRSAGEYQNLQ